MHDRLRLLTLTSAARLVMAGLSLAAATRPASAAEQFELPAEVTPAMRAACEADVRRLCVHPGATVDTVRGCVLQKFMRLGQRCQMEIASAGLAPAKNKAAGAD